MSYQLAFDLKQSPLPTAVTSSRQFSGAFTHQPDYKRAKALKRFVFSANLS